MALRSALLAACVTLAACSDNTVTIPDTCNGSARSCERRYDQVAYATTHNAMSSEADGWVNPNQPFDVPRQLRDGVRGLMLDTHLFEGEVYLCHGVCQLGKQLLVDGLNEIRQFLRANRGEVVTIIFESYISAADTERAFADADLSRYTYAHVAGQPWPTLRGLINDNTRLVVFTDAAENGALDWYMDVWAHAWETDFAARTTDDFSCDGNRGDPTNALFIFNHFLTRTLPVPGEAATTNANPLLIDRARACQTASGKLPNFITLDFYTTGNLFETVRLLNES